VGGAAAGTNDLCRNGDGARPLLDWGEGLTVKRFVLTQELAVIFRSEVFFLESGGSVSGGLGSTLKFR
jgi:hypothetical protein